MVQRKMDTVKTENMKTKKNVMINHDYRAEEYVQEVQMMTKTVGQ